MLTDWVLIHRLAREVEQRLAGARADDAGLLPDGRVALLLRRRGAPSLLAIDPYSSPPIVTVEDGELGIGPEPGFVRALARALRGMHLKSVSSRRDDRLMRLRFAARSTFGVGEELDLYLELVPRYGNLVLVKGDTVVAALKEFGVADNARRAVAAGMAYALPPLPERPVILAPHARHRQRGAALRLSPRRRARASLRRAVAGIRRRPALAGGVAARRVRRTARRAVNASGRRAQRRPPARR